MAAPMSLAASVFTVRSAASTSPGSGVRRRCSLTGREVGDTLSGPGELQEELERGLDFSSRERGDVRV